MIILIRRCVMDLTNDQVKHCGHILDCSKLEYVESFDQKGRSVFKPSCTSKYGCIHGRYFDQICECDPHTTNLGSGMIRYTRR